LPFAGVRALADDDAPAQIRTAECFGAAAAVNGIGPAAIFLPANSRWSRRRAMDNHGGAVIAECRSWVLTKDSLTIVL
jgi:hypothetical protein